MNLSIHNNLAGCEIKYYQNKYRTRVIENTSSGGEALICMHGIGGHAEAFSRNIKRLGERFNVYAMDFLWHGFSQKTGFTPEWLPEMGKQVLDVMDSIGVEKAHLEGESLGGWVATWLALNHPDRLNKIVLNTTAGIGLAIQEENSAAGKALLFQRSVDSLKNLSRETVKKRLEWLMAYPDRVTEELIDLRYQIYDNEDTKKVLLQLYEQVLAVGTSENFEFNKEELSSIPVPTLVLWSSKNPGWGPESAKRLTDLIPKAKYYCIDDAGHWPQWEKAEEHDQVVMSFLLNE